MSADAKPILTRRRLLYAAGGTALLAGAWPLSTLLGDERERASWRPGPHGPLRPDPDGLLDLPEGFAYRLIDRVGETMSDGLRVPARPDGMACFATGDGALALMRNHENPRAPHLGAFGAAPVPDAVFDRSAAGGVTRVVLDPDTLEVRSRHLTLGGTLLNCAGGTSPWGWLSCEETVEAGHGFVFVCDPEASALAAPRPIRAYGRFRHEAAAADPATAQCFLTEDREDGCFYRFVPHDAARPFEGELQALRVVGAPDTSRGLAVGERREIAWVPVRDPAPEQDVVRTEARRGGASLVARGEGLWLDASAPRPTAVFAASSGGASQTGQIFRVECDGDGGEIVLLAESSGQSDFDMPDNLVVAPSGTIYFCEDGHGRNYVRGIDARTGAVFDFARNARSRSELAGVCFSPDGGTMFVALQLDGLTLAVRGAFA